MYLCIVQRDTVNTLAIQLLHVHRGHYSTASPNRQLICRLHMLINMRKGCSVLLPMLRIMEITQHGFDCRLYRKAWNIAPAAPVAFGNCTATTSCSQQVLLASLPLRPRKLSSVVTHCLYLNSYLQTGQYEGDHKKCTIPAQLLWWFSVWKCA